MPRPASAAVALVIALVSSSALAQPPAAPSPEPTPAAAADSPSDARPETAKTATHDGGDEATDTENDAATTPQQVAPSPPAVPAAEPAAPPATAPSAAGGSATPAASASITPLPPPATPVDSAVGADDGHDAQARYPGYVVGGVVTLLAGAGLAVGGVVAAATENEQTAIGLLSLGTIAAGVGVPLVMVGATDERPVDFPRAMAGVAVATPGALGLGLGGTSLAAQLASDDSDDEDLILPIGAMVAGGAALVVGIVVWATGAGHADEAADGVQASFELTPSGARLRGSF